MAIRKCASCTAKTAHFMRSLVAVNCVIGLLLIAFGGSLEKPMNSFPSVAMVLLGILCWVSAVVGLLAGHKYACCLTVFLVMHGFNIMMQVGSPWSHRLQQQPPCAH
jgi:predicted tellurium resistance membrane protein TerC